MIGPNGAGKTTLLKIMLGLLVPKNGSIKLFGEDIKNFKDWKKVGYVPQKSGNVDINFPATAEEVVAMGLQVKKKIFYRSSAEDKKIIKNALEQVDMWGHKDKLIGDLSGGQAQRVFIARALAREPEVIFLDEPTAGVDQKTQDQFYVMLQKFNKELGITIVLISHDLERLTREAMHIACVDRSLAFHVSPEEYLSESRVANIGGENVKIIAPHHHGT
jgi:zinc transport system ATP-binding protein